MNPDEIRELLKQAQEALRAGAPKDAVFGRIAEITGGQHQTTADLAQAAVRTKPDVGTVEAVGEVAGQELTFGISDEIAGAAAAVREEPVSALRTLVGGLVGGGGPIDFVKAARAEAERAPEAAERAVAAAEAGAGRARERLTASREELGTAGTLGAQALGIAPTLLVGGGPAARFIQRGGNVLLRGGRAGLVSGGAGAAEGGIFGLTTAEGDVGERLPAAAKGAATGGLLGTALGGLGGAAVGLARGAGRFGRKVLPTPQGELRRSAVAFSEQLGRTPGQFRRELSELGREVPGVRPTLADLDDDLRKIAQEAVREAPFTRAQGGVVRQVIARADDEAFSKAKRRIFQPLEERVDRVPDADLIEFLKSGDMAPFTREVSQDLIGQTSRPPSFRELQSIRNKLEREIRRRGDDPAVFDEIKPLKDTLDELMEDAVPGFAEANRRFRSVLKFRDAVERTAEKLSADAARPSNVVASEVERGGLLGLLGQIVDAARDLERIERESAEPIVNILLGDEGVRLLREALPSPTRLRATKAANVAGDVTPFVGGILGGRNRGGVASDSILNP